MSAGSARRIIQIGDYHIALFEPGVRLGDLAAR